MILESDNEEELVGVCLCQIVCVKGRGVAMYSDQDWTCAAVVYGGHLRMTSPVLNDLSCTK